MSRITIFALIITTLITALLVPGAAGAQFSASGGVSADVVDRITMYFLWAMIMLAIVLVAMGVFSYSMAYKGHELVQRGNYQMLGALGAIILGVLARLLAFVS